MPAPEDFDELLVACLSRIETEGEAGLEAVCAKHPEQAKLLRERVQLLRGAGLIEVARDGDSSGEPDFPEHLGDFRLLRRLGHGGMGVVYLAEQVSLERFVALKLIRPEMLYFPGARQRFAREVEAVARLAHPGIVPVHVVGEEGGIPFFAMEYVRGASLEEVLADLRGRNTAVLTGNDLFRSVVARLEDQPDTEAAQRPPFDGSWPGACLWIVREVAQALEHAHQRGVLHRDVKPSNVMITGDGRVLLLDFGLASAEGSATLTKSGSQVGSLAYMAPEQVDGRANEVGRETDVYGLGVMLFELLALARPFEGGSLSEIQRAILDADAPDLRRLVPSLSGDYSAVVSKAMAPERELRYPTAADFARDLTRLREQRPVEARVAGPWLQLVRWTQRNRAAAVALGLGLVIAVFGPLLFGLQQLRLNNRIQTERDRADSERLIAATERDEAELQRGIAARERDAADGARRLAVQAQERAELERERAEQSLDKALEAVDVMLREVSEQRLSGVPQAERVRRELLAAARGLFSELSSSAADDADIRWRASGVGVSLADLEWRLGNLDGAADELRTQIAILRDLVLDTELPMHRGGLAMALAKLGSLSLIRSEPERALELTDEALEQLEASMIFERVGDQAWVETMNTRRRALEVMGRKRESLEAADRSVEVARRYYERYPDEIGPKRILAAVLGERGRMILGEDTEAAADYMQRGLEMLSEIKEEDPLDQELLLSFCEVSTMLSSALGLLDRPQESYEVTLAAVEVAESLVRDFPTAAIYREQLQTLRVNLGVEGSSLGYIEASIEVLEQAAGGFEQLIELEPANAKFHHSLGGALANLSAIYIDGGRFEDAVGPLSRAIEAHRLAVRSQPDNAFYRFHLGITLANRALLAVEDEDWLVVAENLDRALPMMSIDPNGAANLSLTWMESARRIGLPLEDSEGPEAAGSGEAAGSAGPGESGDAGGGSRAMTEAERRALIPRFYAGALRCLEAAKDRGTLDRADLRSNGTWDPLRELEGFQRLLRR